MKPRSTTSYGPGQGLYIDGIEAKESVRVSDREYVRCVNCGFLARKDRDGVCPVCNAQEFWRGKSQVGLP